MADNQLWIPELGHQTASTATAVAATVTNLAVTTIAAVERGVKRIISNNSTDLIYMTKVSTTGANTTGIVINANERYEDTLWMGAVYLMSSSTGSDVRYETIQRSS